MQGLNVCENSELSVTITYHHINCQFKLYFDDLYEDILGDAALLVRLTTKGNESVQVLINIALIVVRQLLVLVPLDGHEKRIHVHLCYVLGI